MDLNRVLLIGNLARDPETRHTQQGKQVTNFTIAVNERRGKGDAEGTAMFIKCETWDRTAELVAQYLTKGSQVLVDGRLKLEEYTSKDGQKRRDPVIVADRVSFGAKPRDGQGGGGARQESGSSRSRQTDTDSVREDESGEEPFSGAAKDDLPF